MSLQTWRDEFYPVNAANVSTVDATAHSLRKWQGLTPANLAKHGLTIEKSATIGDGATVLVIDAISCALCQHYIDEDECHGCPLVRVLGHCCDAGRQSPYKVFLNRSDPRPMIKVLEQAVEYEKEQIGRSWQEQKPTR